MTPAKRRLFAVMAACLCLLPPVRGQEAGPAVPDMVRVPGGTFRMGSTEGGFHFDEAPVHKVKVSPFRMAATPVTNAMYEQFDPGHRKLRGAGGFSSLDDEAVVFVSRKDAIEYCRWLSSATGRSFRLPTEAEWEYACRAGTNTAFWTGDTLPETMCRHQKTERDLVRVSLRVGRGKPNPFGLYDMHGLVEEWCLDGYGEYSPKTAEDPCTGEADFYVTRGGSHNTPVEYLRSASRSAAMEDDRHCQLGFRIVETGLTPRMTPPKKRIPQNMRKVSGRRAPGSRRDGSPLWIPPVPFVIPPADGTPFYGHNHQSAVTWCDNGDLLAVWYSCETESDREMVVLASRLRRGGKEWEPASLFFKVPDRNMTGTSLTRLPDGTLIHVNGVAATGDWQDLAMVARTSTDNGRTWSAPVFAEAGHARRHQVIAGAIVLDDGTLLQCCDAGPGGDDGTCVHLFDGVRWTDTGATIPGIHAGVVQLKDGSILAFGRGNPIDGKMPESVSRDGGFTWESKASIFPPIGSGQRLVLKRLDEGPLLLASFCSEGLFAALSYDEGATWPVKKLLTDGEERTLEGGAWTGEFTMDAGHAEPKGYLSCTQPPWDGTIHLLSSRLHYRFNLAWLEGRD